MDRPMLTVERLGVRGAVRVARAANVVEPRLALRPVPVPRRVEQRAEHLAAVGGDAEIDVRLRPISSAAMSTWISRAPGGINASRG